MPVSLRREDRARPTRSTMLGLLQMWRRLFAGVMGGLLFTSCIAFAAEMLQDSLRSANIPTKQFPASELAAKITSYAVANNEPFLLAYYTDDGSGLLRPPLHIIRYDRAREALRRADLQDVHALFQGEIPMDCLGSAESVREYHGLIYIDTHLNPSAGCVIVLSSELKFQAALSGWVLGLMGADYAIVRRSEIHFVSVHPMHIAVFDLKRNQSVEVYPYKNDPQRRQFSRLIAPLISEKWCLRYNAPCDPETFDIGLKDKLVVNEAAMVFGFEAQFDAAGFGDAAEKQVQPQTIAYIFRERNGAWQHREFPEFQFQHLFSGMSMEELISREPDLAFQASAGK